MGAQAGRPTAAHRMAGVGRQADSHDILHKIELPKRG